MLDNIIIIRMKIDNSQPRPRSYSRYSNHTINRSSTTIQQLIHHIFRRDNNVTQTISPISLGLP